MYLSFVDGNFVKQKPTHPFVSVYWNSKRRDLEINKSAEQVLMLCDGEHSRAEIVRKLSNKYNNKVDDIKKYVDDILEPFMSIGIIKEEKERRYRKNFKGNPEIGYPDSLIWEITEFCPLNCIHCYLGEKGKKHISQEEIERVMELIEECGITHVQITGGEPLCHPHIDEIVDQLIKKKITITIATSGFVFNSNILGVVSRINEVGGTVQVSIDGTREYHDYMRGNKGAFDKSINTIKRLVKMNIPVSVATCLVTQPLEMIEELVACVKEIGVSMITISLTQEEGNAYKNKLPEKYTHEEVRKLVTRLNNQYRTEKFTVREYGEKTSRNCGAGYNVMRLKPSMDLTPCPMIDINIGNMINETISEITKKTYKLFLQLISPDEQFCKECKDQNICGRCSACGLQKMKIHQCKWYDKQKNLIDLINELNQSIHTK